MQVLQNSASPFSPTLLEVTFCPPALYMEAGDLPKQLFSFFLFSYLLPSFGG